MRFSPDKHLHSKEHVLADDLSQAMGEQKKFASYLGIAKMYDETDLRALMRYVLEKPGLEVTSRGRYFFGALRNLKGRNKDKKISTNIKRIVSLLFQKANKEIEFKAHSILI